jgi:hypothetical protein
MCGAVGAHREDAEDVVAIVTNGWSARMVAIAGTAHLDHRIRGRLLLRPSGALRLKKRPTGAES